jgi:hypothetical protein
MTRPRNRKTAPSKQTFICWECKTPSPTLAAAERHAHDTGHHRVEAVGVFR